MQIPKYCQEKIKQAIKMSGGDHDAILQILKSYLRSDEQLQSEICLFLLEFLHAEETQAAAPSSPLTAKQEKTLIEETLGVSASEANVVHGFISKIGYHPGAMGESLRPIQGSDAHKDTIRILAKAYVEKRYDDYAAKLSEKLELDKKKPLE